MTAKVKIINYVENPWALGPTPRAMNAAADCGRVAITLDQWAELDFDPTVYWFSDSNDEVGLDPWSTPDIEQARSRETFFIGDRQAPGTKHVFVSLKELTRRRK